MKLFDRFADRGFHTSLATTFSIDFDGYEQLALSRLRGAGCSNNLVVVDGRMLTLAIDQAIRPPRFAGRLYSISAVPMSRGVFHPKLMLQLGQNQGRLIVGSANLTSAGIAGNLEVIGQVRCGVDESPEQRLIADAWKYITKYVDCGQHSISRQLNWAYQRTPWLASALQRQRGETEDIESESLRLFTDDDTSGISRRFLNAVADDRIQRLVVISPYWDHDLRALRTLQSELSPTETTVVIQRSQRLFPGPCAANMRALRVIDADHAPVAKEPSSRFIHAKVVIAEGESADHVLFGSANCTVAAMGIDGLAGRNAEASLYMRLGRGVAASTLGLEETLKAEGLTIADLAASKAEVSDSIPLQQAEVRAPGRFELNQTTLTWWPATTFRHVDPSEAASAIVLYESSGAPLSATLTPIGASSGPDASMRFKLAECEQEPRLAAICPLGTQESAKAVITWADQLRRATRELSTPTIDRALERLETAGEEGLWFLDLVDVIQAAEGKSEPRSGLRAQGSRPRETRPDGVDVTTDPVRLSYEDFVRGRREPEAGQQELRVERSAVADSYLSQARGFLNRILNFDAFVLRPEDVEDEEDAFKSLGEGGVENDPVSTANRTNGGPSGTGKTKPNGSGQEHKDERLATKKELYEAVISFIGKCTGAAGDAGLTGSHALKLRALLMLLAGAGCSRSEMSLLAGHDGLRSMQVLPNDGDFGWTRLMGMLLLRFFKQRPPLVLEFKIDAGMEQVPDDFMECWATCYWAGLARLCASSHPPNKNGHPLDLKGLELVKNAYALTALRTSELSEGVVPKVMQLMNDRFASRLGIDAEKLMRMHTELGNAAGSCD